MHNAQLVSLIQVAGQHAVDSAAWNLEPTVLLQQTQAHEDAQEALTQHTASNAEGPGKPLPDAVALYSVPDGHDSMEPLPKGLAQVP
jgi:hypothetical protein